MSMTFMKWVDLLVGLPVCLVLSILAKLTNWLRPPRSEVRSVLFLKFMGMGSILLAMPAVRAIRRRYPNAKLAMATFGANKGLLENLGIFHEVHVVRTDGLFAFAADTLRVLAASWVRGTDVVVDFEFFSRFSTIFSFLSGARERVGFASPLAWRGWTLTKPVYFNHYRHITENFLAQARALDAEGSDQTLEPLRSGPQEDESVRRLLEASHVPSAAPLFLINVNAGDMCLERRWPPAYFAELAGRLRARYPEAWLLFTGSPGERDYVARVLDGIPDKNRILDVSGQLSLSGVASLMKRAKLLITSESGPLHFAQSVGLPSVSLFGPGPPLLFGPLGPKHRVLYAAVDCSPCLNYYSLTGPICHGDNICMKRITAQEVGRVTEELLGFLEPSL